MEQTSAIVLQYDVCTQSQFLIQCENWPWCCRSCIVWGLLHMVHPLGSWDTEQRHLWDTVRWLCRLLWCLGQRFSFPWRINGAALCCWMWLVYLVMHVRVRTEAPAPQLREQADQPLHVPHSFLKCSCLRARAARPTEASVEGPHAETQEVWGGQRQSQHGLINKHDSITTYNVKQENRRVRNHCVSDKVWGWGTWLLPQTHILNDDLLCSSWIELSVVSIYWRTFSFTFTSPFRPYWWVRQR